ncbi:proto-oncogene serine/threonine-protein kinase mos isoform X2 [Drosophila innubila]|uniref:proto-oncogene serine/threonine-protein kinase mos isoform X2 n=1 Tax=Drosophila innubila TaxID=198719 RepID=UPI00148B53CC|nr:proto-oncogene serine/threonine-protein kinase mos isoform X2 [Drosophila innubila]
MSYIKENAIVLTTPKRNKLLKDGPESESLMSNRCHILGRGSYGIVFKAIFREHAVALKIIKKRAILTLHNEAHALNWNHRNIVRIIKLESTPEFGLIIMERSNGFCLQRVVDTLALPLMHRLFIVLDVLAALRYCHGRHVLHLDVKPGNILIALDNQNNCSNRSYICKLCDFGCSLKLNESSDSSNTNGTTTKGTLRYMSPEALRSAPLSCASDMYSLGITMWQLQSRRPPYYTLTCNETIAYQVVKHQLRPDNYARLKELQLSSNYTKNPPLSSCYCANSVELICSYINQVNPQLDLYKKARRQLNFETSHGRVNKRSTKQQKQNKQPKLSHYFYNQPTVSATSLESAYSDLYRSCWISQAELRLNSFKLQQRLELILHKCLSN